jgi:hypothetical protein
LKALEIKKKIYGENHIEYADIINNLSCIQGKLGEHKEAKE